MRDRQEMEYVAIGREAAGQRNCGLRLLFTKWLLQLFRHSCVCPDCQRLRGSKAEEEVIEF
jgi:hypothetical protein